MAKVLGFLFFILFGFFEAGNGKAISFSGRSSSRIDPSDEEVRLCIKNTARIPCIAHGKPQPFVYWIKDGKQLLIGDVRIQFIHGYLETHDVLPSDAGLYTCVADNAFGTPAEKHTRLIVEAKGPNTTGYELESTIATTTTEKKDITTGATMRFSYCSESTFGCCPDGVSAAKGPNYKGCPNPFKTCATSRHGCCPDGWTPAKGENFLGCDYDDSDSACKDSAFGCCPDGSTPAKGPAFDGCSGNEDIESSGEDCQSSTFGCCPGSAIPAETPDKADCPGNIIPIVPDYGEPGGLGFVDEDDCFKSKFGCCPDLLTPVKGSNNAGCSKEEEEKCVNTLYGCCPDNKTEGKGNVGPCGGAMEILLLTCDEES